MREEGLAGDGTSAQVARKERTAEAGGGKMACGRARVHAIP